MKYAVAVWLVAWTACSSTSPSQPSDSGVMEGSGVTLDAAVDVATDVPAGVPDPALSTLTTDRDVATAGVDTVLVTVTLRDSAGNPLPGLAVQLVATGSGNMFTAAAPTDASGTTTSIWTSSSAGTKQVSAVVDGTMVATHMVMFSPGLATTLAFVVQPTVTVAGAHIAPAVTVAAEDSLGNIVTTESGYAQVLIGTNPSGGGIAGVTYVALVNGQASFPMVSISKAGSGYTLRAIMQGLADGTSDPFDVLPGDPDMAHSTFTASPASLEANGNEAATLTLQVANAYGIPISNTPVMLMATGTNNVLSPSMGFTDANGKLTGSLASTTAEVKTVTAALTTITLSTTVNFHPPACTPRLPGAPSTVLESSVAHPAYALLVADVDRDGHSDVIVGGAFQLISIYRGHGDGTFFPPIDLPVTTDVREMAAGDFNGDGIPDLAIAAQSASYIGIALGTGGGHFSAPLQVALSNYPTQLALGDFNGDGKLDVAAAVYPANQLVVALGAGNGTFTTSIVIASQTTSIQIYDLAAVDVNVDGKLDLVWPDVSGVQAMLGNGDGTFRAPIGSFGGAAGPMFVGDFNGDSAPDVAVYSVGSSFQTYLGKRDGTFQATASMHLAEYGNPNAALSGGGGVRDVDGDGKADIIVAEPTSFSVLKGAGDGTFTIAASYASATARAAVADIDENGTADLVALGGQTFSVIAGVANGSFIAPASHAVAYGEALFPASGDFDHNGQTDLLVETELGTGAVLSHPDGSLTDAAKTGISPSTIFALAIADMTGGRTPDVVFVQSASSGVTLHVSPGAGDGTFAASTSQAFAQLITSVHPVDLDRDGKQDLVVNVYNSTGLWFALNQGNGAFGPLQSITTSAFGPVLTGDVTGDGITDIITSDGSGNVVVYPGNGVGGVGTATTYSTGGYGGALLVGDFTGDGRLDVALFHQDNVSQAVSLGVMAQLPTGRLGMPMITPEPGFPPVMQDGMVVAADVSGDGALDLVMSSTEYGVSVVLGYGDGWFRQRIQHYNVGLGFGTSSIAPLVISDHDQDGRADIAFWRGIALGVAFNRGCVP